MRAPNTHGVDTLTQQRSVYIFTSFPIRVQNIVINVSVCGLVCSPAYVRNQTSECPNFLCMLPAAVAGSSFGGVAIRYAFPVLWMMSTLLVMASQRRRE